MKAGRNKEERKEKLNGQDGGMRDERGKGRNSRKKGGRKERERRMWGDKK